jgi:hypothetical protein
MTSTRFVALAVGCLLLMTPHALASPDAGHGMAAPQAQQRPNFSGRWVIVLPEKGAGREQIIKHDDKTLSKTPVGDRGGPPVTYQIDGVEHRSVMPMRGEEIVIVTKAMWEGNTLVVTTTESYPTGMKLTIKDVWSLDGQGRLVIDNTESAERQKPQTLQIVMQKKG